MINIKQYHTMHSNFASQTRLFPLSKWISIADSDIQFRFTHTVFGMRCKVHHSCLSHTGNSMLHLMMQTILHRCLHLLHGEKIEFSAKSAIIIQASECILTLKLISLPVQVTLLICIHLKLYDRRNIEKKIINNNKIDKVCTTSN